MPKPVPKGAPLSVAMFFLLTRRAARQARMEEIRAATSETARVNQAEMESSSRQENLRRMRDISNAQMNVSLAQKGLAVPGMVRSPNAAIIQAAAGRQEMRVPGW